MLGGVDRQPHGVVRTEAGDATDGTCAAPDPASAVAETTGADAAPDVGGGVAVLPQAVTTVIAAASATNETTRACADMTLLEDVVIERLRPWGRLVLQRARAHPRASTSAPGSKSRSD